MITIKFDIELPKGCGYCPLVDEEFNYCHGTLCGAAWECDNYDEIRPKWCPLVEVKDET